jgi:protein-tyrosine phosphatase
VIALTLDEQNMGAVHGVYLKYVGLSALSYAGYVLLIGGAAAAASSSTDVSDRGLAATSAIALPLWRFVPATMLGYSAIVNGAIAVMFKLKRGMSIIGKSSETGAIPMWSYVVFFPFHFPSILYTHVHTKFGTTKVVLPSGEVTRQVVPVASEVQPGWWVGGCYANELNREWAGIIDQTVEFPESCIHQTKEYFLLPTWDGVPATPEQLEAAATFAVAARQHGDVLVHCAHGRGRSTTVMCACLVKAGLFSSWQEAFEVGIKPQRSVCKLNSMMKKNLTEWQATYIDGKKAQ